MRRLSTKRLSPRDQPQGPRAPAPNPNLYAQRRKVLSKHYRAKYGVKK